MVGTPQPTLKWYKDGEELKAGDIHRITSGGDGTCCLGNYTCKAFNCMGTASSTAALMGLEGEKAENWDQAKNTRGSFFVIYRCHRLLTNSAAEMY